MNEQLVRALRARRDELHRELAADPTFQEYEQITELLDRYERAPPSVPPVPPAHPPERAPPFAPTARGMAAVVDAAATFLRQKGSRAESGEIQDALVKSGLMERGARDRSRVTSYLGRRKDLFDNVRGEGYGLVEWKR